EGESRYAVAPPLYWSWGDKDSSTWIAGTAYRSKDSKGSDTGLLPFWFGGAHEDMGSAFVQPLSFGRTSDGETSSTYLLNTYYNSRPDGYTLASFPFLFAGREGESRYAAAPPLYWSWSDRDSSTWIAGTAYRSKDPKGSDTGLLPFWFGGAHE